MKPLSHRQKALAYRWLLNSPFRTLAEPAYRTLLDLELWMHRVLDVRVQPEFGPEPRELTALIKTFERPDRCKALVDSIRRFYPEIEIIVVDDSRKPMTVPNVITHVLPYDSGVSAGRSAGLELVKTKYVLNLDDDFVFFSRTDLASAVRVMNSNPEIDLMGGVVVDLPLYITHELRDAGLFSHSALPVRPTGERVGGLEVRDKVVNFFIARTDQVRKVDWDPSLKRLDHADFFTRAKGRLLTVHNHALRILHVKNPFATAYMNLRFAIDEDLAHLAQKYAQPWPAPGDESPGV